MHKLNTIPGSAIHFEHVEISSLRLWESMAFMILHRLPSGPVRKVRKKIKHVEPLK